MSLIDHTTKLHRSAVRNAGFWFVLTAAFGVADIVLYFTDPRWLPLFGSPAWLAIGYGYWRGYQRALRDVAAVTAQLDRPTNPGQETP